MMPRGIPCTDFVRQDGEAFWSGSLLDAARRPWYSFRSCKRPPRLEDNIRDGMSVSFLFRTIDPACRPVNSGG